MGFSAPRSWGSKTTPAFTKSQTGSNAQAYVSRSMGFTAAALRLQSTGPWRASDPAHTCLANKVTKTVISPSRCCAARVLNLAPMRGLSAPILISPLSPSVEIGDLLCAGSLVTPPPIRTADPGCVMKKISGEERYMSRKTSRNIPRNKSRNKSRTNRLRLLAGLLATGLSIPALFGQSKPFPT